MGDDDPIGRMRAEMDQAKEGLKQIPALLWSFYRESLAAGFSEAQAMRLTLGWMTITFTPQREGDDE